MITLTATLVAKEGKEELLYEECLKMVREVESEIGCLMYIPHTSVDNPRIVTFFEKYVDQDAFDKHTSSSYFKAFAEKFDILLDEPLCIKFLAELV